MYRQGKASGDHVRHGGSYLQTFHRRGSGGVSRPSGDRAGAHASVPLHEGREVQGAGASLYQCKRR